MDILGVFESSETQDVILLPESAVDHMAGELGLSRDDLIKRAKTVAEEYNTEAVPDVALELVGDEGHYFWTCVIPDKED